MSEMTSAFGRTFAELIQSLYPELIQSLYRAYIIILVIRNQGGFLYVNFIHILFTNIGKKLPLRGITIGPFLLTFPNFRHFVAIIFNVSINPYVRIVPLLEFLLIWYV